MLRSSARLCGLACRLRLASRVMTGHRTALPDSLLSSRHIGSVRPTDVYKRALAISIDLPTFRFPAAVSRPSALLNRQRSQIRFRRHSLPVTEASQLAIAFLVLFDHQHVIGAGFLNHDGHVMPTVLRTVLVHCIAISYIE